MEGAKEVPIVDDGPKHTAIAQTTFEQVNTSANKLSPVRDKTRLQAQRLVVLLQGNTVEDITQEEVKKIETLTDDELVKKGDHALASLRRIEERISLARDALYRTQEEIDAQIRSLEETTGIRKISASVKILKLRRRFNELQHQRDQKTKESEQVNNQRKRVFERFESVLLKTISPTIELICNDYKHLMEEVIQEGGLKELREIYIHETMNPEIERIVREEQIPEERINHFYSVFQKFLDKSLIANISESEQADIRREIQNVFGYKSPSSLNNLIYGTDKELLTKWLFNSMAKEDIVLIDQAFRSLYKSEDAQNLSMWLTQKAVGNNLRSFGNPLNLYDSGFGIISALMPVWQAMKQSPAIMMAAGSFIEQCDELYYQTILNGSISQSQTEEFKGQTDYIDLLRYYPTPESIRNLVIIASANAKNYRTLGANIALAYLSKQPDWKGILQKAESVYPSLIQARPILESWNFREDSNQPDIQKVAGQLTSDIFETPDIDPLLKALTLEALPISQLLDILYKRGIIPESQVISLKEAEILLDNASKETAKQRREIEESILYIGDFEFKRSLRENLLQLINPTEQTSQSTGHIEALALLSQKIIDNQDDYISLSYLSSSQVIEKITTGLLTKENLNILFDAFKKCPAISSNSSLRSLFVNQFTGEETISFFTDATRAYDKKEEQLIEIARLIGKKLITKERALELPKNESGILDSPHFLLAVEFPQTFLQTDQDVSFLMDTLEAYQGDTNDIKIVAEAIEQKSFNRELALDFPKQAPALMNEKVRETRIFVLNNTNSLVKDASDFKFLNTLVGEFGNKADPLIRGYQKCLLARQISTSDKDIVLDFVREFRVVAPTTINGYKEAKLGGYENVYVAQLRAVAGKMTGSGIITDDERKRDYFQDLVRHVYPNNAGNWTSYESNESCSDRTADLAEFTIKPRYELDLLSQSEVKVKAGKALDEKVREEVQEPIFKVAEKMNMLGHDKEKVSSALRADIDKTIAIIVEKGGFQGINIASLSSLDEKLFLILVDTVYGSKSVDSRSIKDLIISYEFATFEDISDYIGGTRDRVAKANNQDYALLCEIGAFYSDRIKEVNRRIVEAGWNNPEIAAVMPGYFKKLTQETRSTNRQGEINRFQVEKLATSPSFVEVIRKQLEKRYGEVYRLTQLSEEEGNKRVLKSPEEIEEVYRRVRRFISMYEQVTDNLPDATTTSTKPQTRAIYGQLRSQRERTFEALKAITGKTIDPEQTNLGEINLQQALDTEASIREGKYDEGQFVTYTVQKFTDVFDEEKTAVDSELAKFESSKGNEKEVLYGYITKSKETAHARMVGGVCVSGDNPKKDDKQNMWGMPNYLQLVLQEPDTLQCQGLALLHHFTQGGKKILTASLNPSSTYLYSVDEAALQNSMIKTLEQFAIDNQFDVMAVSRNHTIRTNRTGGEFERSLEQRISQKNKTFKFNSPQQFSYHPIYQIQDMDVVWER